jgi:hypothetical protein
MIWGRRYHKYKEGCKITLLLSVLSYSFICHRLIIAAYVFPNDVMESDRLDLQYEALKLVHGGKIYFAPLTDPKRILDVGTGTGAWAIEMGESLIQY